MINIPEKTKSALDRNSILSINASDTQSIKSSQNIGSLNRPVNLNGAFSQSHAAAPQTGQASQVPRTSQTGQTAQAPRTSQAGQTAQAPRTSQAGQTAQAPRTSQAGQTAQAPRTSQAGQTAQAPRTSQAGQTAQAPRTSQAGQTAQAPRTSQAGQSSQPPQSSQPVHSAQPSQTMAAPPQIRVPALKNVIQKGQKVSLGTGIPLTTLKACFGWNTSNSLCDMDVSAFLLGDDKKVPGDSWFVFYGQTASPDNSTEFRTDTSTDREIIRIDFTKLNPAVKRIVFVLTINEAFEKNLNFGMMKDTYMRILNEKDNSELVSFQITDYYSNIISMMIGEIYQHNGEWKFNAIGNGVAKDLAGLCTLYGVQVSD